MMRQTDKKILIKYIAVNIVISLLTVVTLWFTGRFTKGILDQIGIVLYAPGFIILVLFQMVFQGKGDWEALHDYSYPILLIVSFVFYSFVIALIQIPFYKRRVRKQAKLEEG